MRTFILTLVLLFTFSSSSWAGQTIYFGDKPKEIDVIEKDGKIYVPIRTFAENLNCSVFLWDGLVHVNQWMKRPSITCDAVYTKKIDNALILLQEREPVIYQLICENVTEIGVSNLPQVGSYSTSEDKRLLLSPKLLEDTEKSIPEYIGGIIGYQAIRIIQDSYGISKYRVSQLQAINYKVAILANISAPEWACEEARKESFETQKKLQEEYEALTQLKL